MALALQNGERRSQRSVGNTEASPRPVNPTPNVTLRSSLPTKIKSKPLPPRSKPAKTKPYRLRGSRSRAQSLSLSAILPKILMASESRIRSWTRQDGVHRWRSIRWWPFPFPRRGKSARQSTTHKDLPRLAEQRVQGDPIVLVRRSIIWPRGEINRGASRRQERNA